MALLGYSMQKNCSVVNIYLQEMCFQVFVFNKEVQISVFELMLPFIAAELLYSGQQVIQYTCRESFNIFSIS